MSRRLTPLTAKLNDMDIGLKRGRVSTDDKIKDVFYKNAGDSDFINGLNDLKTRISARTGSSMTMPLEEVFRISVRARMKDPTHPQAGELRGAITKALEADVFTEQRSLSSTLTAIENLLGRVENTGRWKKFKKETGYAGDKDDFANMVRRSGQEIVYEGKDGQRWLLKKFYDITKHGIVADWQKL